MSNFYNSYYVITFVHRLTFKKFFMDSIVLSYRQFLRLAHSLGVIPLVHTVSSRRVKLFFISRCLEVTSYSVTISYAKKWFPLIMGDNLYRNSILYCI